MSFILDALRKSEAARRRSEAPDLFATMPVTHEPMRARPNWPLWLLGAVAAISLIALLWLLAQRAPEAPTASAPTSPTVDASAETGPSNDAAVSAPALDPVTVPIPPQPRRFVILDGQRLREGDLLGELVIERITREGAVLAWRGGQLQIELR